MQVIDAVLRKVVKNFSGLLVSQSNQVTVATSSYTFSCVIPITVVGECGRLIDTLTTAAQTFSEENIGR